jgi:hypothetical protein
MHSTSYFNALTVLGICVALRDDSKPEFETQQIQIRSRPMKRSFRAFLAAVLIAVPVLASCNDANNPIAPTTTIERQDGLLDLVGGVVGGAVDVVGGLVDLVGVILSGPDANGAEKSAWIDSDGGSISTAAYTLTVPRGAVSSRTKFVITPTNTGTYTINLEAYEQGLLGLVNVGKRGFRKPVLLTISYANANGVTDIRKLGIVYLATPTTVEIQPTSIDTRDKDVTAQLSHFSKYAMIQN